MLLNGGSSTMRAALPLYIQITNTSQSQLAQLSPKNARSRVPRPSRCHTCATEQQPGGSSTIHAAAW
eukprot:1691947-Karenia_brevis.AAC.1